MNKQEKPPLQEMLGKAENTAAMLKVIANPLRLMVLCALVDGEKNVSTLTEMTQASQTLMSNHLAVLRKANIVDYRRDHRTLYYFLKDLRMKQLLLTLYTVYCQDDDAAAEG